MARFYGSIRGNRGEATRMGSAKSGFFGSINGWNVGASVSLSDDKGKDCVSVRITSGSNGRFSSIQLATFTEDGTIQINPEAARLFRANKGRTNVQAS